MCVICGATVTYLSVKMAKTFPDKRIWALVAFVVIVFFAGVITLLVGSSLVVSSKNSQEEVSFKFIFDPNFLMIRYVDEAYQNKLYTLLTQSPDGHGAINYSLINYNELQQNLNYESDDDIELVFDGIEKGVGRMTLSVENVNIDKDVNDVACYNVSWKSDSEWLEPTDCFEMAPYGDYWFGGSEMYYQWWPINRWEKEMSFYLSGDMYADAQQYGSVLERYWLSTSGVALYVDPHVPLHVSTEKNKLCFKGTYKDSPYKPGESKSIDDTPFLKYTVCMSPDARKTHEYIFLKSKFLERPKELPDLRMMKSPIWSTWARYKQNVSQEVILQYADEIEFHNFSVSQIEIDDGYEESYGDYTFDPEKFPNASAMIQNLHDRNFRVTTWVTPFVNPKSVNYNTHPEYFVQDGTGAAGKVIWWDGIGRMIDFTNPEACDWYVSNLENVRKTFGVDSFKFDAGEVNYLTSIRNYSTHEFLENPGTYTTDYADCAHRLGNLIEVRASWRNQVLPIFVRMMDKDSNWTPAKGLKTIIPTSLTFSLLGYPYILPDMIGGNGYENGFLGNYVPERELYIRWLEITAFLPSMQFSISPWQYDDEVTKIAQYYVSLHENVIHDELVSSFQSYSRGDTGMGAIQPIWWIAPTDVNSFNVDDEFLVGSRYLVAPIVENATRTRDIYLPGPLRYDGNTALWVDRLRTGRNPVKGGVTVKNYRLELGEISWWESV